MEKIKLSEKVTNIDVLELIGVVLLSNMLCKKANWIGHILRITLYFSWSHGRINEGKEIGRRMKLSDNLKNGRTYRKLHEDENQKGGNKSLSQ